MKRKFADTVWIEGKLHIAQCLEVDVASQGTYEPSALENLTEALQLHFENSTIPVPETKTIEVDVNVH